MTDTSARPAARTRLRHASLAVGAAAVSIGVIAAGCGVVALAPDAVAAPPGTNCGTVRDRAGRTQPVIVLSGDVDCSEASRIAAEYLAPGTPVDRSGTLLSATVDGWSCEAPLVAGRSHADSYLQCSLVGSSFKIGN